MANPAQARIQRKNRAEAVLNRRVLEVAKGLAATIGSDFFHSIVRHLAVALKADCAYLGECVGPPADCIRTLAVFGGRKDSARSIEQKLSETASGQVLSDGSFACSREAKRRFPLDQLLWALDAEGFIGIRLSDSAGQPLGLLSVVSTEGFGNLRLARSVLESFVPRAAAELERKRADDLRTESEQRYHAFISTNPDAMWRLELEQPVPLDLPEEEQIERILRFGYLAECNDALARLAGAQFAVDLSGARFDEIATRVNPEAREELRSAIRSGFTTTVETTATGDNGQRFYRLRSQFGIVEDGALRRIWGTTRDISELRRTELCLAASERRFREVLESVQLPALMLDLQGKITFANACFLGLAQRSRKEVAAMNWLAGVFSEEESRTWKEILQRSDSGLHVPVHFEAAILRGDGTPRVIAWNTVGLFDQHGQLAGVAAIGRDITLEKALEQEIRKEQKLDSIGRLATGVAHDFNNLLLVAAGYTDRLLKQTRESDPARGGLLAIEKAIRQCTNLTGQLLAIGRKQTLQPRLIDLNEVIAADEENIRNMAGDAVELVLDLASPLGLVYADPIQIQRCLANLVTNARNAMVEGGKLIIATSILPIGAGEIEHPAIKPGPHVRLSVSDNGPGLPAEIRMHIFEPFFTTRPGSGFGLGLSTVYGIVTQSGGHVEVHSEPGRGTTFDILLPLARE